MGYSSLIDSEEEDGKVEVGADSQGSTPQGVAGRTAAEGGAAGHSSSPGTGTLVGVGEGGRTLGEGRTVEVGDGHRDKAGSLQ